MTAERLFIQGAFFKLLLLTASIAALLTTATVSFAQSTDQYLPTPVLSNEIDGTIAALDIGDSRLTRHYYAFEATPGDLIVTVNTRNLNGDVDIFTATTFRPLTKISIYANAIPPEVTKSLYFRTQQILILRVEARTPNDDPGVYRINFGGSFQPFSGGIAVAENVESASEATTARERNRRRLSSVGATLPQPPEEAKPEEPKPAETVSEAPAREETVAKKPRATRTSPRSSARNRPARTPRSRPAPTEKPKKESTTEAATSKTAKAKTEETKPAEGEEKSGETPAPKPPVQEPSGPRLIIEKTDGTRIERPMSTVRRVVVESSVIVVVLKNGRIERVPMSAVARMAIEP